MKTFASGHPLSGWHFICPCGWSTHRHAGDTKHLDDMSSEVQDHYDSHARKIRKIFR